MFLEGWGGEGLEPVGTGAWACHAPGREPRPLTVTPARKCVSGGACPPVARAKQVGKKAHRRFFFLLPAFPPHPHAHTPATRLRAGPGGRTGAHRSWRRAPGRGGRCRPWWRRACFGRRWNAGMEWAALEWLDGWPHSLYFFPPSRLPRGTRARSPPPHTHTHTSTTSGTSTHHLPLARRRPFFFSFPWPARTMPGSPAEELNVPGSPRTQAEREAQWAPYVQRMQQRSGEWMGRGGEAGAARAGGACASSLLVCEKKRRRRRGRGGRGGLPRPAPAASLALPQLTLAVLGVGDEVPEVAE